MMEKWTLLATVTWTNPAGGDWSTASDWSAGRLPGSGDDVVIPALNSGASVTHSSGNDTVLSVTGSADLNLSGGTLTVTGDVQVATGTDLLLEGGTLARATVTSGSTITLTNAGGTLSGATIASGATIDGTEPTTDHTDVLGVANGMTLDGTLELGSISGSVSAHKTCNELGACLSNH